MMNTKWLEIFVWIKRSFSEVRRTMIFKKRFGGFILDYRIFKQPKNRLVILANGDSINDISKDEWEDISACDSLALNSWSFHDFEPTYYLLELPISLDADIDRVKFESISQKIRDRYYKSTVFILKARNYRDDRIMGLLEEICRNYEVYWPLQLSLPLQKHIKVVNAYLFVLSKCSTRLSWNITGSLYFATQFAYKTGYKHVKYFGVDLKGKYFWQKKNYEVSRVTHNTNRADRAHGLVISELLRLFSLRFRNKIVLDVNDSIGLRNIQ